MSLIDWDQSFNVGHAEVDRQHREFMTIMNEMESLLLAPSIYNRLVRLNILERQLEFADKHFRLEKELMQEYGYSETSLCNHWRSYKIFDANIYTLQRVTGRGNCSRLQHSHGDPGRVLQSHP